MMTVGEIVDILRRYPSDMEVRIASQPSWPFEYEIADIVSVESDNDGQGYGPEIVYIGEGRQIDYLSDTAATELGWRD